MDELRKSGIEAVGEVPWGAHFCQFYQTKDDLTGTLVPYFKAGLENNEFCIWVTRDPLTPSDARDALRKAVPDFNRYLRNGQIELVPHKEWYLKGGSFDPGKTLNGWAGKLEQALARGYAGMRVSGDTAWVERADWDRFAEYEAAINGVPGAPQIITLCTYPLSRCNASDLMDIMRNHELALMIKEGKWQKIENTASKEARLAQVASERKYRGLFNAMTEGFALHEIILDGAGKPCDYRFLEANSAFERLTRLNADKLRGKTVKHVMPHVDDFWIETFGKVALTGDPVIFERYSENLNVWYEIYAYSPEKGRFVSMFRDITQRKRSEEAIKASEQALRETKEYLENLFSYANAPIIVWDPQFRITRFNRAFERLTGLSVDQVLGEQLDVLFPGESRAESMRHIRQAMAGERWETVEIPVKNADGTERIVLWNSANIYSSADGSLAATIAQGQDITERKRAEDALREREAEVSAILETAPMLMLLVDPQRRVLKSNKAAAEFAGRRLEEMIGLRSGEALRCLHALDDPRGCGFGASCATCATRLTVLDTVEKRNIHYEVECRLPFIKEGKNEKTEEMIFLLYTFPLNLPQERTLVCIQDVTALKQSEQAIRKLNAELTHRATDLEAVNSELESFAYSISHDLRAPLRSMEGFSQILQDEYLDRLDEMGKDCLRRIQMSSQTMAQLIDDILQLSRIVRSEMQRETVDLSLIARSIVSDLKLHDPTRTGAFRIARGIEASGDAKLLRLVLMNLLDNAWKFTARTQHPRIEFGVTEVKGKKTHFVRDNGVGFDMAYVGQLFRPFQRLHSPSDFPGTGIGLASVQRIIRRHGGEIWAQSEPDKGATFFFTLG